MKFCWHKYSKWSEVTDTSTRFYKCQFAKCEKCGKVIKRLIDFSSCTFPAVPADKINEVLK